MKEGEATQPSVRAGCMYYHGRVERCGHLLKYTFAELPGRALAEASTTFHPCCSGAVAIARTAICNEVACKLESSDENSLRKVRKYRR